MTALSKIQSAGFVLSLVNGNLNVTPTKTELTDTQRTFIKSHKDEIMTELKNENNSAVVSCGATVKWLEIPDPEPNELTVTCYTPNGKPIKVQANDEAHAAYLIRTNPKPQEIK